MTHAKHVLPYRRKREGRTNYKKRLALLKSGRPRLVIRKSNRYVQLQLVRYHADGDRILVTVTSKALAKLGWTGSAKSIPAAYLTGILCAKEAKAHGVADAIVDLGFQKHRAGTRLCAAIKGAIDGGLAIPASEEIFPSGDRINGVHTKAPERVAAVAAKLGVTLPKPDAKKEAKKGDEQKPKKGDEQKLKKGDEQKPKKGDEQKPKGAPGEKGGAKSAAPKVLADGAVSAPDEE